MAGYEWNQLNPEYSYTVKKFTHSCRLKKGRLYFVNLLPVYSDSTMTAVLNVTDDPPINHRGWTNQLDECYFNDPTDGYTYVPCNQVPAGPFDEFSIALTGR